MTRRGQRRRAGSCAGVQGRWSSRLQGAEGMRNICCGSHRPKRHRLRASRRILINEPSPGTGAWHGPAAHTRGLKGSRGDQRTQEDGTRRPSAAGKHNQAGALGTGRGHAQKPGTSLAQQPAELGRGFPTQRGSREVGAPERWESRPGMLRSTVCGLPLHLLPLYKITFLIKILVPNILYDYRQKVKICI